MVNSYKHIALLNLAHAYFEASPSHIPLGWELVDSANWAQNGLRLNTSGGNIARLFIELAGDSVDQTTVSNRLKVIKEESSGVFLQLNVTDPDFFQYTRLANPENLDYIWGWILKEEGIEQTILPPIKYVFSQLQKEWNLLASQNQPQDSLPVVKFDLIPNFGEIISTEWKGGTTFNLPPGIYKARIAEKSVSVTAPDASGEELFHFYHHNPSSRKQTVGVIQLDLKDWEDLGDYPSQHSISWDTNEVELVYHIHNRTNHEDFLQDLEIQVPAELEGKFKDVSPENSDKVKSFQLCHITEDRNLKIPLLYKPKHLFKLIKSNGEAFEMVLPSPSLQSVKVLKTPGDNSPILKSELFIYV